MLARSWSRNSVCLFVRQSACLSVTRVFCEKTKQCTDTTRKGNLTPTVVGRRHRFPIPSVICAQSDQPHSKTPTSTIFAHNVSTVRDSKKFIYDEQEIDHGLSNELYVECVRYP